MPKEGENILDFKNLKSKKKGSFVIYADLESVLKPWNNKKRYQVPAAFRYYVKSSYDNSLSFYHSYRGPDCIKLFADQLQQFADIETVFLCGYDMNITPKQEAEFKIAMHCHICEQPFLEGENV